MNNHDKLIIKVFFKDNKLVKYNKFIHNKKYYNIKNYLENRFKDFTNLNESLYRILYHIDTIPVCKYCGNSVKFKQQKYNTYCCCKCANSDKDKINKERKTKLLKYGDENFNNREKDKQTKLLKYGNENFNNREKFHQTCLLNYGTKTYVNPNKAKETIKLRYGVNSSLDLLISRNNRKSQKSLKKEYQTKKKNHTFNTSIPEKKSYELLKQKYPDVKYQYRSELYPFNCDFYIPSLDLYIECNYHWTHGEHPYDQNNLEDQKKVELWKTRKSKYYEHSINTWTIGDVKKRNIAKQNNLNYLEFYNLDEFYNWYNKK